MIRHFHVLSPLAVAEVIPQPENLQVFGFRCFENIESIVVPIVDPNDDQVVNTKYFYCKDCKKWLKMSATIGNIKAHIKSKHPNFIEAESSPVLNTVDRNRLAKQYIITNGLPFSTVDDSLFAQLFPGIGTRKAIALLCSSVAKKVKKNIKTNLTNASEVWLTADEWSDAASQSFLGIHIYALFEDRIERYTIAHQPLMADHSDAVYLSGVIHEIMTDFSITNKTKGIVTDTAAVMEATVNMLNVTWVPCFCHIMNLILGSFVESLDDLEYLFYLQSTLGSSTLFHNYVVKNNSPVTALPSYTITRWYSLYKLLKNVLILQPLIESYIEKYNTDEQNGGKTIDSAPAGYFQYLENIIQVISTGRNAMLVMEADTFGTISRVMDCFRMLHYSVHNLPNEFAGVIEQFDIKFAEKWIAYFNKYNDALLVSTRLNPYCMNGTSLTQAEINEADGIIGNLIANQQAQPAQNPQPVTRNPRYGLTLNQFIENRATVRGSELQQYQAMVNAVDGDDLLKFWTNIRNKLPTLTKIALSHLLIPPTSAATERDFSKAKRAISMRRLAMRRSRISDAVICVCNQEIARTLIH